MSKLIGATAALVAGALAIAIASLILNIIILGKVNNGGGSDTTTVAPAATTPHTTASNGGGDGGSTTTTPPHNGGGGGGNCQAPGKVSTNPKYMEAAQQLLRGLDTSYDPCTDMYNFACAKYIRETNLNGLERLSTFEEAQNKVNLAIAAYVDGLDATASFTEQVVQKYYQLCTADAALDPAASAHDKFLTIQADLNGYFGFPLFNDPPAAPAQTVDTFFTNLGRLERELAAGVLTSSLVTVDYMDGAYNALYVSQPNLQNPLDYYTLPQYIANLDDYRDLIVRVLTQYQQSLGLTATADLTTFAESVIDFERKIAMSSWPGTEQRNYKQQYNAYMIEELATRFPNIRMQNYVNALIDGIVTPLTDKVVLNHPTFFFWLDGVFASGEADLQFLTSYAATQLLLDNVAYLGVDKQTRQLADKLELSTFVQRNGKGLRRLRNSYPTKRHRRNDADTDKIGCIEDLVDMAPQAAGYVYTKLRGDKYDVRRDLRVQTDNVINAFSEQIDSLPWMADATKAKAHEKSTNLVRNYLWPDDLYGNFRDTTAIDAYNQIYQGILDATTFWQASKALKTGYETKEFFSLLAVPADRFFFLSSPAWVNAWYQPERNSITFPIAILNQPYYDLQYPQAYNYAGQGGTGGHELTHGYDDEGIQFGPAGPMVNCTYTTCGLLDSDSRKGFVDMAQCVVTQFNAQCCPLKSGNVRCVNGATTQGENIADLGGQLAAYRAYRQWVADQGQEEDLLPGLENYTPNQIFWMTYSFSWCMKITDARLVKQLLTDVHSPSQCRVNQVMQGIPEFGRDFNCPRGSNMFPQDEDRCKVWIGY